MPTKIGKASNSGAKESATSNGGGGTELSLKPSDQVSEGLLDDMDVTFEDMVFTLEQPPNYTSQSDKVSMFLKVHLKPTDGSDETDQYYSAGDSRKFQPSEDGKTAVRMSGSGGMGQGTNAAVLFRSIVDAGFPEDKITASLTCFEGIVAHVRRIAVERKGLPQQEGKRPSTVLAVEKIIKLPWENKSPNGSSGKSKSSTPAPSGSKSPASNSKEPSENSENSELSDEATAVLAEVLNVEGKAIKKSQLAAKAFKILASHKDHRTEILTLYKNDDFLSQAAENLGATYDGEVLAPAE